MAKPIRALELHYSMILTVFNNANYTFLSPMELEELLANVEKHCFLPNKYRKIPKISPRAYIFQRPFLRGLFLEGLIYRGKLTFQNRLGKPYSWKETHRFCFVLLCIWGQFPITSPRGGGGLYLEGQFNGGLFTLRVWGAYTWWGLFVEFYGMFPKH